MAGTNPTQISDTSRIYPESSSPLDVPEPQAPGGSGPRADSAPSEPASAEGEPRPWRAAVIPSYHRKTLFAIPVEIQTRDLPRWRPRSLGGYGRASQDDE